MIDDYLTITFRKRRDAPQLSYRVEVSDDLVEWREVTNLVRDPPDNGGGIDSITMRDDTPANESSRRFIRVKLVGN